MKLYEICICVDIKRCEYEVSKIEFNKTFNYIKLLFNNNILSTFLNSTNEIDIQFKSLFIISFKSFSEGDIKKLTRYIRSHNKE